MITANENIINAINSPVRQIKGSVELFYNSARHYSGEALMWSSSPIITPKVSDFKVSVRRKNLIPYPYYNVSGTINGITYTINSDNTITASGTAVGDSFFYLVQTYKLAPGTYHLGSSNLTTNNELRAAIYNLDNTLDRYVYNGKFTITSERLIYIYIVIINGTTVNNITFNPYLILPEDADVMLYYSPYITDLTTVPITINDVVYYPDEKGVIEGVSYSTRMNFIASGVIFDISYLIEEKKVFASTDLLKSFTLDRLTEEGKFFGVGICQHLIVKLIDTERSIEVTTDNQLGINYNIDGQVVKYHPNRFYITQSRRNEATNELTIYAYDLIFDASKHTFAELGLIAPYTIRDVAIACANYLGATGLLIERVGENETCFDTSYDRGANFGGEENLREVLNDIAEATQTIYFINHENYLVFKRLDQNAEPDLTITKEDYIKLDTKDGRRLSAVCHATELGDNVSASIDATGTTQYVRENAFWNMREDIATIVENALAAVGGLSIRQFNCSWRGNPLLEIGDKVALVTKDNDTVITYLLDDTIEYTGAYKQQSQWEYTDTGEDESNPSSLGEVLNITYAKVNKIDREIDLVASKTELNSSSIAKINLTTNDIQATVEEVKKGTDSALDGFNDNLEVLTKRVDAAVTAEDVKLIVQSELEKGVNSVTTITGFTFNQDGLTVNKSDSEMTTQISEDGMIVFRDDTPVLVANNEGVDATNLRATTYLVIGDNSRFEDYDNNRRTGCFWIGR